MIDPSPFSQLNEFEQRTKEALDSLKQRGLAKLATQKMDQEDAIFGRLSEQLKSGKSLYSSEVMPYVIALTNTRYAPALPLIEQAAKAGIPEVVTTAPGAKSTAFNRLNGETKTIVEGNPVEKPLDYVYQPRLDEKANPVTHQFGNDIRTIYDEIDRRSGKKTGLWRYEVGGNIPNPLNPPATRNDIEEAAKAVSQYEADLSTLPRQDKTKILARARQINPKFNQINYNANRSLKQQYTSGRYSQNIVALNTAIGHLADLRVASKALQNGDIQLLNALSVQYGKQTGKSAPDQFEAVRDAVSNELATVFKGSSGTDIGLQNMLSTIYSKQSPQQVEGVVKTNVKLLKSRLDALAANYKKQTGVDFPVLDEEKRSIVDEIMGKAKSNAPSDEEIDKMTSDQLKEYLKK